MIHPEYIFLRSRKRSFFYFGKFDLHQGAEQSRRANRHEGDGIAFKNVMNGVGYRVQGKHCIGMK